MGDSKEKKVKAIGRSFKGQVTLDPNDSTNKMINSFKLNYLLKKRITQAEIWTCPLEHLCDFLQSLWNYHQGIVLTMADGKKYIVHKLSSEGNDRGACIVLSKAKNMGKHWSFVRQKDIRTAKLEDYLKECGDIYDPVCETNLHAVARMWTLQ